jgi:hypothetical protein
MVANLSLSLIWFKAANSPNPGATAPHRATAPQPKYFSGADVNLVVRVCLPHPEMVTC